MKALHTVPFLLFLFSCTSALSEEHRTKGTEGNAEQHQTFSESHPLRIVREDSDSESSYPVEVLQALHEAYPDRVEQAVLRNDEWTVRISGKLFYWTDGRLLPEDQREDTDSYDRYSFRPYPRNMPELPQLSADQIAGLKKRISERETEKKSRNPAFMNALWGMADFESAEQTVVPATFLGQRIRIHPYMEMPLSQVEQQIIQAAAESSVLSGWLNNLGPIGAYVWRDIAGSANRSLHSYGIAIDIQPRDYRGKQAYWRWARDYYPQWWAIPYSERYPVPTEVVEAFENNGFIWGGKWLLFDQIHFEYRPELLLLGESGN